MNNAWTKRLEEDQNKIHILKGRINYLESLVNAMKDSIIKKDKVIIDLVNQLHQEKRHNAEKYESFLLKCNFS
jgi:hypothetical protein